MLKLRLRFTATAAALLVLVLVGCQDDASTIRSIQSDRKQRMRSETQVDHLSEAFSMLSRLSEMKFDVAARQISYHLNAWQQNADLPEDLPVSAKAGELLATVSDVLPEQAVTAALARESFAADDVQYLKLRYLQSRVTDWVRTDGQSDPLWRDWVSDQADSLGAEPAQRLSVALQLFDWTVRNISLEPDEVGSPLEVPPKLPDGLRLFGPGYRQTPYQTLFRGSGDWLQRTAVFIGLCRQADLPACLLSTAPSGDAPSRPWAVGVAIADQVYLFDCRLGVPIPGPNQRGIATLAEARRDNSVLRRMNVPGWFEYPLQQEDVQQCIALLLLQPEGISRRARRLHGALTGQWRMAVYDAPGELAATFEAISGIASSRIWEVPLQARLYARAIELAAAQDPRLEFVVKGPWMMLEGDVESAQQLTLARWSHLQGQFDSDEAEMIQGAKQLYIGHRAPEFEIVDLRSDVELQKQYGIRRPLGMAAQEYDMQIRFFQDQMRMGKICASYWLSHIQYDTGRFDVARNWYKQRILDEVGDSAWEMPARYNLGRTLEQLDQYQQAIELYRTEGDLQEHGNRIRARLLQRRQASEDTDAAG